MPGVIVRLGVLAVAAALAISACGDDDDAASEPADPASASASASAASAEGGEFDCDAADLTDVGGELTIYSGRSEELVAPLLDCFEEQSGIDVEVRYAGSDEIALQIAEEGDDTDADVFFSQTPGPLGYLEEQGRFRELPSELLELVDDEYQSPTGSWIGASGRVRTLVYNTDAVEDADLPATIDDVLDPEWEGRLGVAPSNASFQDFIAAMLLERGEEATAEFLVGLAELEPRIEPNNVAIVDAVGRGEIDAGLVNHYYGVQALREDPELPIANHFFPSGDLGSFVLVAGAGILDEGADHQQQAEAFMSFLLSPAAQTYFATETGEYPLAGDVPPPEGQPELSSVGIPGYDEGTLGQAITDAARLIEDSGLATG
jgi:iron(III) transport system substrate-binding protein